MTISGATLGMILASIYYGWKYGLFPDEKKNNEEDEYYLVLGGTLWRINEKEKVYQTFVESKNSFCDMTWLGDKLEHEVECAKHLGEKLTYEEMLQKCQQLKRNYDKRAKEF